MPSTWGQKAQYGEFKIVGAAEGHPKLLGEGSFGKTFEAVRADSVAGNVIEERVALKVLDPELLNSESKRVQFVREHTALTRLKHANLVHSIKCGEDGGEVYFAMELCVGGDLAGLVKRFGPLPERVVALIGRQAAAGLREMHRLKMIHRDIKPPNIMLFEGLAPNATVDDLEVLLEDMDSLCRIVDFGLVGTIMSDADAADPAVGRKFVGTMMYASPEQILRRKDIDGRADIYALGMTLWYLLQGRGPLLDERGGDLHHVTEAEQRHLSSTPHDEALPAGLSREFRKILAQTLAKRPEERFASARELASALERYLEKSARARPVRSKARAGAEGDDSRTPAIEPLLPLPEQSGETLKAFFAYDEDNLKSIKSAGRVRLQAENCSTKRMALVTIVEDLDETDRIRKDFEEVKKKVFAMAQVLRQPDVPGEILPVQDVIWASDALAYAEDVPEGVPLSEVIQARTAAKRPFSFREAEAVFRPLAEAFDYLMKRGWDLISLPCEEVWLWDSAVALTPEDRKVLCRPLTEWSDLRVTFSAMWVPPKKSAEQAAEELFASKSEADGSVVAAESLRPPVPAFLRLVYRTLSGSDVPDAADRWREGYISSVALQTSSNNLIRDLLCKQRKWPVKASHVLDELCDNEGVSVEASHASRSERSSHRSQTDGMRPPGVPGSSLASAGSVSSSLSAVQSTHGPPPLPQQPASSAAGSQARRSSSGAPPPLQAEQARKKSGRIGIYAAAAAVVVAVLAYLFVPRTESKKLGQDDPPPQPPKKEVVSVPPVEPPPPPKSKTDPAPPPEPPSKPRPLSVPDGYETIQAAIDTAKPGETVRIKAGPPYGEQIRLRDGVSLEAEESRRVVVSIEGKVGSVLEADGCKNGSTIKGIVFSHGDLEARPGDAPPVVNIVASKVTFEDCVFEKGLGHGLQISARSSVTLVKCESRRNSGDGFVIQNASADFNECVAEGNQRHGVSAAGTGYEVKVVRTVARRNGGTGFMVERGALMTATETDSIENAENGVGLAEAGSQARWQDGVIRGNGVLFTGGVARDSGKGKGIGVAVVEGALFSATKTVVSDNWKYGLTMQKPGSGGVLAGCMVSKNAMGGFFADGLPETSLLIEGGEISGNQQAGVTFMGQGFRPVLKAVRVFGNAPGLVVMDKAEPQIEGCAIEKNGAQDIDQAGAGPGMVVK